MRHPMQIVDTLRLWHGMLMYGTLHGLPMGWRGMPGQAEAQQVLPQSGATPCMLLICFAPAWTRTVKAVAYADCLGPSPGAAEQAVLLP